MVSVKPLKVFLPLAAIFFTSSPDSMRANKKTIRDIPGSISLATSRRATTYGDRPTKLWIKTFDP